MTTPRANVAGLGLMGGSIALALRERGWHVTGDDLDAARVERALTMHAIDAAGFDASADITFVATPVLSVVDQVKRALADSKRLVTDVGSVKSGITSAIEDKLSADQESQRMTFVLTKERQEADRKRIEAQGIADFQKIVAAGISPQLLEWKGIEATEKLAMSPNTKIVVVGNPKSGLPIILGGQDK